MDAARLDKKITIYTQTRVNNKGDLRYTKTKLIDLDATVFSKSITNEEGVVIELTNFFFRFYPGINYDCLIEYNSSIYTIKMINPVGRNVSLSIDAIRKPNN